MRKDINLTCRVSLYQNLLVEPAVQGNLFKVELNFVTYIEADRK